MTTAPPTPVWKEQSSDPSPIYGGFWSRIAAYVLDLILANVVSGVLAFIFGAVLTAIAGNVVGHPILLSRSGKQILGGAVIAAGLVLGILYFAAMESSERGATFGKRAFGLRVVTSDGRRVTFLRALGRYLAKFISALILGIGFLMVGFTDKKRGLHDMIAGTLVVKVP